MLTEATGVWKVVLSVLFFPLFFQNEFFAFAWGVGEPWPLRLVKWLFLLPAVLAFILACWVSMASLITIPVRQNRSAFLTGLFITWWDLGRSVFAFWGGAFRFVFYLAAATLAVLKLIVIGAWAVLQDFILFPFRVVKNLGENVTKAGVPWIAVFLTLIWAVLEAAIFTYVTTPVVIDTFSNMTGNELGEASIRIPLFIFMLFIVLGSYAVLSTWTEAVQSKNVAAIVKISVIEGVTLFVEVVFLYREFVDSLVPWFAQHTSGDFELGIVGILLIASLTWFGIRGISWFLFASHGTPTLMAVLRGSGIRVPGNSTVQKDTPATTLIGALWDAVKGDINFVQKKGDEVLGAFIIPPLQVVAAAINFLTLLVTSEHLFRLPFKSIEEVMNSKVVLHTVGQVRIDAHKTPEAR